MAGGGSRKSRSEEELGNPAPMPRVHIENVGPAPAMLSPPDPGLQNPCSRQSHGHLEFGLGNECPTGG